MLSEIIKKVNMSKKNFKDLLESGVHFGHLKKKYNPAMAPYIFYGAKWYSYNRFE